MGMFPKSPLTLLFGQLGDLRQVSSDTGTPGPHAGEMRGVISYHACDPPFGPERVELNVLGIVDDGFDALLGRMLDRAFSIFDGRFAQCNETLQSRWDFFVGVRLRIGPAVLVARIVRQRAVQVNDFVVLPGTDAALWTKKNNFHFSSLTRVLHLRGLKQFKSFQPLQSFQPSKTNTVISIISDSIVSRTNPSPLSSPFEERRLILLTLALSGRGKGEGYGCSLDILCRNAFVASTSSSNRRPCW